MNILARPLGVLLKRIYTMVGNYGVSIIIFTVLVKLLMVPLTLKQNKSTSALQTIQPKLNEIKEKYKDNPNEQNAKTMALYKKEKINPYAGCFPLLIQLPIILGLFTVLRQPEVYVFASEEIYLSISTNFLWMSNLVDPDTLILPILAGITTYLSSITASKNSGGQSKMILNYALPLMMFWWGRSFAAGLTLYWVVSNTFQVVQQVVLSKLNLKKEEVLL